MKRFFVLTFAVMIFVLPLSACGRETVAESNGEIAPAVSVYDPSGEQSETVSSSAETSSSDKKVYDDKLYYASKNTKKFHYASCPYAKQINNENLYITEDRDELANLGYVPCKNCIP